MGSWEEAGSVVQNKDAQGTPGSRPVSTTLHGPRSLSLPLPGLRTKPGYSSRQINLWAALGLPASSSCLTLNLSIVFKGLLLFEEKPPLWPYSNPLLHQGPHSKGVPPSNPEDSPLPRGPWGVLGIFAIVPVNKI